MAPCIEIVKCTATPAYRAEGTKVIQECLDILKNTPGLISVYTGPEVQDEGNWYLVNVWESQRRHQDLIDNKNVYTKLRASLNHGAANTQYLYHVTISPNEPYASLSAPLSEFAIWSLNEGSDKAAFSKLLTSVVTLGSSWKGVHPGGWGPVVEDDRKFVVLLGWESLEEFKNLVSGSQEAQTLLGQLSSQASLDLKHAVLTKH